MALSPRCGSAADFAAMFLSTAGISVPSFVIGALLIFTFGIWLKVLPVALWETPRHMILPALTLAVSPAAYLARLTRASVLEILEKTGCARRVRRGSQVTKPSSNTCSATPFVPIATVLGPLTAILVTGSFVVEFMYAIPGMGRLLSQR